MEYKLIKNDFGEVIGAQFTDFLTLQELEKEYPRSSYPKQWESLERGEATQIS